MKNIKEERNKKARQIRRKLIKLIRMLNDAGLKKHATKLSKLIYDDFLEKLERIHTKLL